MICKLLLKTFTILVINLMVQNVRSDPLNEPSSYLSQLENKALYEYLEKSNYLTLEDIPDRIIGGVDALPEEAPFQAQLLRKTIFKTSFMCGGSIISDRTILTAGHCVSYFFNYRIRYGSKSRLTSPFDDLEIKHIRLHPDFDLSNVQNDIALFILKSPIVPSSNVRAIELQTTEIEVDTNMTLYGFGLTNGMGNAPSIKLQKTYLQILNETQCSDFITNLGITKGPGMMCAAAPERSACNGDSGGPLIVSETGLQAGIVSFGTRYCPPGATNVYTNVSHYIDWINENMEK